MTPSTVYRPECPRCRGYVSGGADQYGPYLRCMMCGWSDNGLAGAEPFRIRPKNSRQASKDWDRVIRD